MEAAKDYYVMEHDTKFNDLDWSLPKIPSKPYEYRTGILGYQETSRKINICEISTEPLYAKFKRLLNEWRKESMLMSSITDMVMLQSYQTIIGMGPAALRLILNELKHNPDYLFYALEIITETNPILHEEEGNLERMTKAWLKWGRREGIIT